MELLGKRERYQEALGYYEQLCDVLEEEGRTPDARTTDLKEFLCAKQLQRSLPRAQVSERVLPVRVQGHAEWPASPAPMPLPHGTRAVILPSQALDLLSAAPNAFPDTQDLGAWLALGTGDLTVLFDVGWTTEDVLDALRVTLQAVQDMPQIARQQFLRLSSAALMKDIALPASETLSQQEQTRLYVSLGQSIAESWKLFHTSKPSLMLIIAQAQLTLVERLHVLLHPTTRPFFYAALYRLIGASLYLFGSFEQAQHALEQSYLAGLQTANAWHMAQSLSWQAYLWHARGEPSHALDTIEQALRLISFRDDLECLRLRARLLALGAEYLALVGDASGAHERLGASQALLSALSEPHEEFDTTSWLQQAGICALHLRDYSLAIQRLERAFDQLPSQWRLRSLATAIPLAKALTRAKKAGRAIEVAQRVIPLVTSVGASVLTQQFVTYLEQDLLAHFPDDKRCQTLVIEARQQLERHSASH
jgi:tetratricopeptide (TPR) repeat protein